MVSKAFTQIWVPHERMQQRDHGADCFASLIE